MASPNVQFSIVLMGRFPGKDRAVAQALAQTFGQDDTWGLQVVGATPITVLTGLTAAQAQAIYRELVNIEEGAGCRFRVQPGLDDSFPSISWPSPPTVSGRAISEFGGSGLHPAPAAGAATAAAAPAGPGAALACPHCRKPIQVAIMAPRAAAPARPAVPAPAAAQAAPGRSPIPIPIPKPAATPARATTPAKPAAPAARAGQATAPRPMGPGVVGKPKAQQPPVEAIEAEDLEELTPLPETPSPAPRRASAKKKSAKKRPAAEEEAPLPEVPVVASAEPAPGPSPAPSPVTPMDPRLSGPMALEDFEKGLMTGPSDDTPEEDSASPVRPASKSARKRRPRREPPPPAEPPEGEEDEDLDQLCSIFIGRNHNPKVHELVAEIQGITPKEAQKICQKSVVPIVKDIPLREADAIKNRFRQINVNPRVTLKR